MSVASRARMKCSSASRISSLYLAVNFRQQPPRRRRREHPERPLNRVPARQIGPPRRDRPRTTVDQPADKRGLAMLCAPPKHLQLEITQIARRGHQPHPLRQKLHNMSSATGTRSA